jgi:CheY-like chemotaxis protein
MNFPTVLLIEDDEDVRETLVRLFERSNFKLLAAGSGKEAIQMASHFVPDLIVADFHMRAMNGAETVRTVRHVTQQPGLPAVMISGDPTPEVAAAANRLGMTRFFPKPFLFSELIEEMRLACAA